MENPFSSSSRRYDIVSAMEKRQLFLRSYHFSRKRSVSERINRFAVKVKRVILFRLQSVKKLRKVAWSELCFRQRRFHYRFGRLVNSDHHAAGMRQNSSCLW
ncbi:hypothetical protein QQ045_023075 [Rhodiola kirilowii]